MAARSDRVKTVAEQLLPALQGVERVEEDVMVPEVDREGGDLGAALGAATAILVAGALVGLRHVLSNTSVALILVLVIVGAATIGGRKAGVFTAIAAGIAFDFFHTQPYNRLTINSADDVETLVLLVVVGLAAGELVTWGRDKARRGAMSHDELGRVRRVADVAVHAPPQLLESAIAELTDGLLLRKCWYESGPVTVPRPEISPRGTIFQTSYRLSGGEFELPRDEVALPIRVEGGEGGRFVLVPTEGVGVARDRRLAAVAIADIVALTIASGACTPS
jgi:Domain of unknown function (DUF4118)